MKFDVQFEDEEITVYLTKKNQHFVFEIADVFYDVQAIHWIEGKIDLTIDNDSYTTFVSIDSSRRAHISFDGNIFNSFRKDILIKEDVYSGFGGHSAEDSNIICSPMPGKVIKINVTENEEVKKGDVLVVVESMKMENNIIAPKDGIVQKVNVHQNDMVESSLALIILE